jgi:hypothetical protein
LAELKRLYEEEFPETVHGNAGATGRWGDEDGDTPTATIPPFREVATSSLGVKDPSTVNRYVRTAERRPEPAGRL